MTNRLMVVLTLCCLTVTLVMGCSMENMNVLTGAPTTATYRISVVQNGEIACSWDSCTTVYRQNDGIHFKNAQGRRVIIPRGLAVIEEE